MTRSGITETCNLEYNPKDFVEHYPSGISPINSDVGPLSILHGSGNCNITAMKGGVVRRCSGVTRIFVRNRGLGIRFENHGSASITKLVRGKCLDDGVLMYEGFEGDPVDILLVSQISGSVYIDFL